MHTTNCLALNIDMKAADVESWQALAKKAKRNRRAYSVNGMLTLSLYAYTRLASVSGYIFLAEYMREKLLISILFVVAYAPAEDHKEGSSLFSCSSEPL